MWVPFDRHSSQEVDLEATVVDGRLVVQLFAVEGGVCTLQDLQHRSVNALQVGDELLVSTAVPMRFSGSYV